MGYNKNMNTTKSTRPLVRAVVDGREVFGMTLHGWKAAREYAARQEAKGHTVELYYAR